jgi:hypothetical protein
MKKKYNCWEVKKCGREPGGSNVYKEGVCSAASNQAADSINSGINGGRCCWIIAGTFCQGNIQGSYAQKVDNCLQCDFYTQVQKEEGKNFKMISVILEELKQKKQK